MLEKEFEEVLRQTSALRKHRQLAADMVLDNPALFEHLLNLCFRVKDEISYRACWVLEFVYKEKPVWLVPRLDYFLENASSVQFDQSVRPIAKICQMLAEAAFSKKPSDTKEALTDEHLEKLTELTFDWLINDEKVAAKAYAIHSLYLLGIKYDWIYPELLRVLEQDYSQHSAAYKAAARNVLKKIS
ncbi:hypothetical protein ACFQ1M_09380 [Sungkyunkwania multivorans]|uniref:Adenylosuccinate lyase n=1 Tax=Sungkyunkwania multivorans TaxID=1173618 RepID=A0ABW3CXB7_9FLAO